MLTGIAVRLATRRRVAGIPRKTLAKEIGVSTRAVIAWECGERSPTLRHAIDWARALGAEIEMTGA